MNSPGRQVPNMLLEKSEEEITPQTVKGQSQSKKKKKTPSCGCDVMAVKSDAVKSNIAQEPGMLGP